MSLRILTFLQSQLALKVPVSQFRHTPARMSAASAQCDQAHACLVLGLPAVSSRRLKSARLTCAEYAYFFSSLLDFFFGIKCCRGFGVLNDVVVLAILNPMQSSKCENINRYRSNCTQATKMSERICRETEPMQGWRSKATRMLWMWISLSMKGTQTTVVLKSMG